MAAHRVLTRCTVDGVVNAILTVVGCAFVGVAEDVIGCADAGEPLACVRVCAVAVWVVT